jgi:uncharacterized membrane protein YphA (DoxX/SURF4 family)
VGGFGYVCGLVLAVVFIRAGAAKLARRDQTEESFAALRLPAARHLTLIVPLLELAVAVALLAAPPIGGVAALVILVLFTAVIVRAIASGVSASCNCFGAARSEPVSMHDVIRNVVLGGLATAAVFAPAPTMPSLHFGSALSVAIAPQISSITTQSALPTSVGQGQTSPTAPESAPP